MILPFRFRPRWLLALLLLLPVPARAQGIIVVDDERYHLPHVRRFLPRFFPLQIKSHRVEAEILGSLAETKIEEVFYNPNPIQMEGTYLYPIPPGAAFDQFRLTINGRDVAGEILDKDKAREIYESIVRKSRDPALLEYVGGAMFRARVFPIPARGEFPVKLIYSQILPSDGALREYRYPLHAEKFSSAPIGSVSITCRIEAKRDLQTIYSPTHSIDVRRDGARKATAGFEMKDVRSDRDFQLFFSTAGGAIGLDLITHRRPGEEGYFLAILSPRHDLPRDQVQPKDIVFVLDTSGSMADDGKLVQARGALRTCISRLSPEDRFSVIEFATEARSFRPGLVQASDAMKAAARSFVEALEARGGTNIHDALIQALEPLEGRETDRPYMVCFLTDGLPTVGIAQVPELLSRVQKKNRERARIFVFGVGYDVNTHLLDKIAEGNRGIRTYVSPKESIEAKVSSFYDRIASPVLTDISLEVDGVWTKDVHPKRIPDLFRGGQVILLGRYKGDGNHSVKLVGSFLGERKEFVFEGRFSRESEQAAIPRLWAMRKVGYLLDQIRLHGESVEMKDEVVRLAKRYGIITPYTSYLVMEEGDMAGGGGRPTLPARVLRDQLRRLGGGAAGGWVRRAPREMEESVGKASQDLSKRYKDLQGVARIRRDRDAFGRAIRMEEFLRRVGEKTFYLDGTVWVDSSARADAEAKRVVYLSDEYFALLKESPAIGRYLAQGPRVRVTWANALYEIVE